MFAKLLIGIKSSLRYLRGHKAATFGLIITILFALMAAVGPNVIPLDLSSDFANRFQLPSLEHPLGTDFAGRDVLAQVVHGSRDCVSMAFFAGIFTTLFGVFVGILAGFLGGWVDTVLMRLVDILLTIPTFPIMMVFAVMLRVKDPVSIGLVLSLWAWAGLARAVRAQILSLKEREFIEAAKLLRLSTPHILFSELMPNLMSYIVLNFIRAMRGGLTAGVGLMFLGIIPYSPYNWGVMIDLALKKTGSIYVPRGLFYTLSPMIAIILFQYGLLCLGRALEEIFNPRLRAHE